MSRWRLTTTSLVLAVFGLFLLAGSGAVAGSGSEQTVDEFTSRIDRRVDELMDEYHIPGVVLALVREGELVWSAAYGYANIETGRPMTVDTVNRAESISKSVTAWGVMTLVEDGRLGLDDPIADHIDRRALREAGIPSDALTVRQLLSHSAGVSMGMIGREYAPDGPVPSLLESLSGELQLVRRPDSGFLYSNTGFNLLELLIEEVAGDDFAAYMQREVLDPLGMHSSSFVWSEELTPPVPLGYELDGSPVPVYVYPEKASGGLFASVEDIARFVIAGMTGPNPVLESETIDQLYTPVVEITGLFRFVSPSYGLGHFLETLSNGEQAVWHGGQGHGWMTDFHSVPATGDGIVVMANSQRAWPLIAGVLSDWSEWNEFSPVGFAVIARLPAVAWIVIGLAGAWSTWQLWRLGAGLRSGSRALAPLSPRLLLLRIVQAGVGATLTAAVIWDVAQDYSFLDPILPAVAGWLRLAVVAAAAVLLLTAVAPPALRPKASTSNQVATGRVARS